MIRLGIDVGGTSVKLGRVDENGRILSRRRVPIGADRSFDAVMAPVLAACDALIEESGGTPGFLGMGVPSSVVNSSVVVSTPNLDWEGVDARARLQEHYGCPVVIANDADCAALAEYRFGAGAGCESLVLLTIGTGVGGGVVLNGEIRTGRHGFGLGCEPGHMKIVVGGERCGCGGNGCLEAYASATALIREAGKCTCGPLKAARDAGTLDAEVVFDAARAKDSEACRIVASYIRYLAAGIGNALQLLRPDRVLLGGGVSQAGDILFLPLREEVKRQIYAGEKYGIPEILPASMGNDAGIIGAAYLG